MSRKKKKGKAPAAARLCCMRLEHAVLDIAVPPLGRLFWGARAAARTVRQPAGKRSHRAIFAAQFPPAVIKKTPRAQTLGESK